jgi:hypothetical protein
MPSVKFGNKSISLPASRPLRIGIGVALLIGGCLGFLPILGFWMIPLGLIILSADFPAVRRVRRRWTVALTRWWHRLRNKPTPKMP